MREQLPYKQLIKLRSSLKHEQPVIYYKSYYRLQSYLSLKLDFMSLWIRANHQHAFRWQRIWQRHHISPSEAIKSWEYLYLIIKLVTYTFDDKSSHFYFTTACSCSSEGSHTPHLCDSYSGQCYCKPGVTGVSCDTCEDNFYNFTISGCTGRYSCTHVSEMYMYTSMYAGEHICWWGISVLVIFINSITCERYARLGVCISLIISHSLIIASAKGAFIMKSWTYFINMLNIFTHVMPVCFEWWCLFSCYFIG